ncbi:MAG: 50S ribosomal protein L4 [Alphaproteobacteria bacterium]|nr:50S ribosomal protein L4 [Alphaproteobacteria bacterium]
MKCDVINLDSKSVGSVDLADAIFGLDVREDILHRVVRWQLAKRQSGNHKTKTVGEISGSNKKPFKQKGTGRARQGNARAPQKRGGGKSFGPVVRSHAHALNKKVRRLGLKTALSAKAKEGSLIVIEEAKSTKGKTKQLAAQIKKLGWKSALIIDGADLDEAFCLAARNIIGVDVLPEQGANVYDILRREKLVLTKAGLEKLEERLK